MWFLNSYTIVTTVVGIIVVAVSFVLGYKAGQIKAKLTPVDVTASTVTGAKQCFERNFTLKSKGKKSKKSSTDGILSGDEVMSDDGPHQHHAPSHEDNPDFSLNQPGDAIVESEEENRDENVSPSSPVTRKQHLKNSHAHPKIKVMTLEEAVNDIKHYSQTIVKANNVLHSIIGTSRAAYSEYDLKRSWQMIFSNGASQFYTSKSKEDGILIRGNSTSSQSVSPQDIVRWMLEEDLITGLEGIAFRSEIIQKIVVNELTDEYIIIRRLCCKAGTLMSSKRDFILITSISLLTNSKEENAQTDLPTPLGVESVQSYMISTRSVPEDFISPQRGAKNGGYIRGLVFGSGFILRAVNNNSMRGTIAPANGANGAVESATNGGTEISFAVHMDMLGSRSGRTNVSKTTTIVTAVVQTMARIQAEVTPIYIEKMALKPNLSRVALERRRSVSLSSNEDNAPSSTIKSRPSNSKAQHTNTSTTANHNDEIGPLKHAHSEVLQTNSRIQLTSDEKDELVCVAKNALFKLRNLHSMLHTNGKENATGAFKWDVFYEQDNVVLRELSQEGVPTPSFGVLSAVCSIEAPPHIVRTLLVDHPDAIDGLLEGRSVLNYLTATTYVQWLAYGAIYPMGAKDFLLVTSEESFNKNKDSSQQQQQGFVIASTSIDDICEMDHDESEGEPGSGSTINHHNNTTGPQSSTHTSATSSAEKKQHRGSMSSASSHEGDQNDNNNTSSANGNGGKGSNTSSVGSGYNRSCLKLAGYVGVANATGGTDLTLVIDLDIYSDSPAWLLQLLSQYGLTETMNRIRKASVDTWAYYKTHNHHPKNMSGAPQQSQMIAPSMNDQMVSPADRSGANTAFTAAPKSTSELSKMLLSIQNREMRMMQYNLQRNDNASRQSNPQSVASGTAPVSGSHLYTNYKTTNTGKLYAVSENNTTVVPNKASQSTKFKRPSLSLIRGRSNSKSHPKDKEQLSSSYENELSIQTGEAGDEPQRQFSNDGDSGFNTGSEKHDKSEKKSRFRSTSISAFVMNNSPSLSRKGGRKNKDKDSNHYNEEISSFSPRGTTTGTYDGIASAEDGGRGTPSQSSVATGTSTIPQKGLRRSTSQQSIPPVGELDSGLDADIVVRHRTNSQQSQSSNSNHNEVACSITQRRSRSNSVESVTTAHDVITATVAPVHPKKETPIYTDPQQRQGALIAATALNKIQVYLKLPTDHLHFAPADVAVKDIFIDWSLKVSKANMSIYTSMVVGSTWQAIRAVTVMKADKHQLLKLLTDDSRLGEYDDMFDFFQFVAKVDNTTAIRRVCFKAVWPTAPRDFLICTTHEEQPDGSILIATMSAPDTMCAQQKGYVRGSIQISGYHIQPYNSHHPVTIEGPNNTMVPIQHGDCKVTLTAHSELGGTLPVSVINMLSTNAPMKILQSIADIMKKGGK